MMLMGEIRDITILYATFKRKLKYTIHTTFYHLLYRGVIRVKIPTRGAGKGGARTLGPILALTLKRGHFHW